MMLAHEFRIANFSSKLFLAAVFAGGFFIFANSAAAATEVGGGLSGDHTWTVSGSPYIIKRQLYDQGNYGVALGLGATLTIEPGVVVKFEQGVNLTSGQGKLTAVGTAENPIVFTALTDDSVGGDTNGDGSLTLPARNYWGTFYLNWDHDRVQFAEIRYGSSCLRPQNAPTISHNTIENCTHGILTFQHFKGAIEDNILRHNLIGLNVFFPDSSIYRRNKITDNTTYGFLLSSPTSAGVLVSENEVAGSLYGILLQAAVENQVVFENNNIHDNTFYGVFNQSSDFSTVDARNNWWGHASGPFHTTLNPAGLGDRVSNGVLFDPWLGSPPGQPTRNPVIIVPGIPGTELFNGSELVWLDPVRVLTPSDSFLDELLMDENGTSVNYIQQGDIVRAIEIGGVTVIDYSASLINELENSGYIQDRDLFVFPYDWRQDINIIFNNFHNLIQALTDEGEKVDIVAHSMGGILAKQYILNYGGEKIDKLIFVGTPHLGAPKAASTLIFGDQLGIPLLNPFEVKKIARNMPAMNELLPNRDYFEEIGRYLKTDGDPLNYDDTKDVLLEVNLNASLIDRAESFYSSGINNLDLSGIEAFNINGCDTGTLGSFKVNPSFVRIPLMPKLVPGDGTVPLGSSKFVDIPGPGTFFVKGVKHSTMMTYESVRKLIIAILTGDSYSDSKIIQDGSQCKLRGKILGVFSPVEIKVFDQDGNYAGPNEDGVSIDNSISGVTYEVLGEEKFVYLPTEEGQTYDVLLDATDTGTFDFKIVTIDGVEQDTVYYNEVSITPDSVAELVISDSSDNTIVPLDRLGDGNITFVPASSVLNPLEASDETPPITTADFSGTVGNNGWYRSEVEVTLGVKDENSGILKTEYSLDGENWQLYNGPFIISEQGVTSISFFSTDRAGNHEDGQAVLVNIDTAPPEANIEFDPSIRELVFNGVDNLQEVVPVENLGSLVLFTDQAGNTTELVLKKKLGKSFLTADISEIRYNGIGVTVGPNKFGDLWKFDKDGNLNHLEQFLLKSDGLISLSYALKTDQTVVITLQGGTATKEIKPGLIILKIKTNQGEIEYEY